MSSFQVISKDFLKFLHKTIPAVLMLQPLVLFLKCLFIIHLLDLLLSSLVDFLDAILVFFSHIVKVELFHLLLSEAVELLQIKGTFFILADFDPIHLLLQDLNPLQVTWFTG